MTETEWRRVCAEALEMMREHVWSYSVPIIREVSPGHALAHGTGNYLWMCGAPYLLTNEHVIRQAEGQPLFHQPEPGNDYLKLEHTIRTEGLPIDAALMRIGPEWSGRGKQPLPMPRFDVQFSPVVGEVLFLLGFPGSTAPRKVKPAIIQVRHTWFESIDTVGVPFIGQQVREPRQVHLYDATRHFQVHYRERAYREVAGPEVPVPNLMGMSGSLLWDTKLLACRQSGQRWTADQARVCGLVWGDNHEAEIIIATRIEFVRPVLLQWLREERAYLHWKDRREPLWEHMVDWDWATQTFPDITGS